MYPARVLEYVFMSSAKADMENLSIVPFWVFMLYDPVGRSVKYFSRGSKNNSHFKGARMDPCPRLLSFVQGSPIPWPVMICPIWSVLRFNSIVMRSGGRR